MQEMFPWVNAEEKTGLDKATTIISDEISGKLEGIVMHSSIEADNKLMAYGNDDPELKNIVKACSEALMYAVAKCFSPNNLHEGFVQSFYPRDEEVEGTRNTKLLISVLSGGKSTTSLVKFHKFFLIIDAATASDPYKIMGYYQKFLTGLKK